MLAERPAIEACVMLLALTLVWSFRLFQQQTCLLAWRQQAQVAADVGVEPTSWSTYARSRTSTCIALLALSVCRYRSLSVIPLLQCEQSPLPLLLLVLVAVAPLRRAVLQVVVGT